MKTSAVTLVLFLLCVPPVICQQRQIEEGTVIGSWLMKTPQKDCHIVLREHNMMTIFTSTRTFLGAEECIKTSWKISVMKILIDDKSARPLLGDFLSILHDKGEAVLVPENEHEHINKEGTKFATVSGEKIIKLASFYQKNWVEQAERSCESLLRSFLESLLKI